MTPAFPLLVTQFYSLLIHSLFGEGRLVTNCFFRQTFELPGCWNNISPLLPLLCSRFKHNLIWRTLPVHSLALSIFEPRNVRASRNAWTCTRHVLLQVSCELCLVEIALETGLPWLPHSMSNVSSIVASSVWASALVKEQSLQSLCRWPNPICNTMWCHTCCALVRWSGCLCLSTAPRSRNLACTSRNMHTHTLVAEDGTGTNQDMLVTGDRPWTLGVTPRQLKNLSPSGNHATTNYDWCCMIPTIPSYKQTVSGERVNTKTQQQTTTKVGQNIADSAHVQIWERICSTICLINLWRYWRWKRTKVRRPRLLETHPMWTGNPLTSAPSFPMPWKLPGLVASFHLLARPFSSIFLNLRTLPWNPATPKHTRKMKTVTTEVMLTKGV